VLTHVICFHFRDREELTQELGFTAKKRSEDYENLDAISIQADMWRSKYLASRYIIYLKNSKKLKLYSL
jgi:hypothetical protein